MHAIVLKEKKGIVQVVKVKFFGLWTNSSPDQGRLKEEIIFRSFLALINFDGSSIRLILFSQARI